MVVKLQRGSLREAAACGTVCDDAFQPKPSMSRGLFNEPWGASPPPVIF